MNTKSEILKSIALASVLVPSFIFAADRENVDPEPNPSFTHQMLAQGDDEKEVELGNSGYVFDRCPNIYLPSNAHLLVGISALGNQIELEDGSIWEISYYDTGKVLEWSASDPLVILQNTSWFSKYDFRVVNRANQSSIAVKLSQGPFKEGPFARNIIEIDYANRLIKLTDGSHWQIHPGDQLRLFEWNLLDPVIIGQNAYYEYDSTRNIEWESMLIDVSKTSHFIRAHQY